MIILASALSGAALGAYRAKKLGGKGLDMAQYGIAHAMAFGIVGLVVTVVLERTLA